MKRHAALLALLLLFAASCSTNRHFHEAEDALKAKNWDVAVANYSKALQEDPDNAEIKFKLNMAKIFAARIHYEEAKRLLEAKNLQQALAELEMATQLDPDNQAASDKLTELKYMIEHPAPPVEITTPVERPLSELPSVALNPEFKPKSDASIELRFKDTSLREVLQTLGKLGDVNVLFDREFTDLPVSFDFVNTTFMQALDTVLTSTHNFYKVIGKNTIVIASDNPQKRQEYEETVSRTFFLSSAEVEEMARTLRNVLGIQMIATNVRLNAITIKDRITRVRAAERLVAQLDKAKPEVVVDVEILEVNRSRFQEYGLQIHTAGSDGIETNIITRPEQLRLDPGPFLTRSNFFVTNFPQATFRLLRRDSDSRLLASLPLRTVVGETGRVRFGSQVPVPQTTFAPIATGGVNQQPITSFIYRDVGINIDITPRVHRNGEVTLEVIIESSSIAGQGFGNLPQFSTSRVEKTIRLREGETNIIAGLIRDEERRSMRGLPVLSSIPVLGKFFAANESQIQETDVVLALSPHIIRELLIGPHDEEMLWLGIEDQQGSTGAIRTFTTPVNPAIPNFEEQPEEEAPEEEQKRRNRRNNNVFEPFQQGTDDTTEEEVIEDEEVLPEDYE